MTRLKEKYREEVVPRLMEVCSFKNIMQTPHLEKIVLNIGLGEAITNAKALESAESDLVSIAGQHAVTTRSKKSIVSCMCITKHRKWETLLLRSWNLSVKSGNWKPKRREIYCTIR